jgi:hypothetical protein
VVVADIVGKESLEVALVAGDDMVEQIAAATAHPSLGDSILPWTAEGGANRFCAHGSHGGQDFKPELQARTWCHDQRRDIWRKNHTGRLPAADGQPRYWSDAW